MSRSPEDPVPDEPAPSPSPAPAPPPAEPKGSPLNLIVFVAIVIAGLVVGRVVMDRLPGPAARTSADLEGARAALAKGDKIEAARAFYAVLSDPQASADPRAVEEARAGLLELGRQVPRPALTLDQAQVILGFVLDATIDEGVALIDSMTVQAAVERAASEATQDPAGAAAFTKRLAPVVAGTILEPRWAEAREKALAARADAAPEDLAARIELADFELERDPRRSRERLEPVAAKLGDGEGARVLGLARQRTGAGDEAVALLASYVATHLEPFERAVAASHAALDAVVRGAREDLKTGRAPRELAERWARSSPEDRERLEAAYAVHRGRKDRHFRDAQRAALAAEPVVTAALALGVLETDRAARTTGAERRSHLAEAERLFWAVRDRAGVEDRWAFFLAKLRWWLGKEKDARDLVDSVLDRRERSARSLLEAGSLYATVRATADARALLEEAYGKATTAEEREQIARVRSTVGKDALDQLAWIEKGGSAPATRAMVSQARAQAAWEEGRFDDAKARIAETLAFVESKDAVDVPQDQLARLHVFEFQVTGATEELDRAIALLEKTSDGSASSLDDLADLLLGRAVVRVVEPRIRTFALREYALELVPFASKDEAELVANRKLLREDPARRRALELREKSLALDPTQPGPWGGLVEDARALHDADALSAIEGRLANVTLDRETEAKRLRDHWTGADDDVRRAELERARKRGDAILADARATKDAPTIARALVSRASVERELARSGGAPDPELDVKLSREAHELASRASTRRNLANALLARAVAQRGAALSPALANLARDHRRLGAGWLLALAARKDADLATKLAADADVKAAAEVLGAGVKDDAPVTLHDAVVLGLARDARAEAVSKRLVADRYPLLDGKLALRLVPESPEVVLELEALHRLHGDEASRKALLEDARKRGVPLPWSALE